MVNPISTSTAVYSSIAEPFQAPQSPRHRYEPEDTVHLSPQALAAVNGDVDSSIPQNQS